MILNFVYAAFCWKKFHQKFSLKLKHFWRAFVSSKCVFMLKQTICNFAEWENNIIMLYICTSASCKFKFILCKMLFETYNFALNSSLMHVSILCLLCMLTWRNVLDYLHSFLYVLLVSTLFKAFLTILKAIKNSLKLNFPLGGNFHMFAQQQWILLLI